MKTAVIYVISDSGTGTEAPSNNGKEKNAGSGWKYYS